MNPKGDVNISIFVQKVFALSVFQEIGTGVKKITKLLHLLRKRIHMLKLEEKKRGKLKREEDIDINQ